MKNCETRRGFHSGQDKSLKVKKVHKMFMFLRNESEQIQYVIRANPNTHQWNIEFQKAQNVKDSNMFPFSIFLPFLPPFVKTSFLEIAKTFLVWVLNYQRGLRCRLSSISCLGSPMQHYQLRHWAQDQIHYFWVSITFKYGQSTPLIITPGVNGQIIDKQWKRDREIRLEWVESDMVG